MAVFAVHVILAQQIPESDANKKVAGPFRLVCVSNDYLNRGQSVRGGRGVYKKARTQLLSSEREQ